MKMKNRILPDLILACTTMLYAYAAGAAPKGGSEPLSVTDPTAAVPAAYTPPQFLQWTAGSNVWKSSLPVAAVPGFSFVPESDSAPRLFANAEGNERYFWLKPLSVRNSSKAAKKKPAQPFSLKPASTSEGSMEERIRTGAYHYDIVPKTGWRDWIKPEAISDKWDGFLIYGTDAAPVALISFNF